MKKGTVFMEQKGFFKKKIYVLVIAYAVAFALFYAAYLIYGTFRISLEWLEYARYLYLEAIKFVTPALASAMMIAAGRSLGTRYALLRGWVLSLPLIIYAVPSYYVYYLSITYDSLEAIIYALANTLFDLAVFYLQTVIGYLLVMWLTRLHARRARGADIGDLIDVHSPFDLSESFSFAFFITVALRFLVLLVIEIIDTVSFLNDFSENYRVGEIVYMLLSYLFLLGELLFSQWFSLHIKNKLLNQKREENEND